MLDTALLRDAYRALLEAAVIAGDPNPAPPAGQWNADQILAHVAIITATTIAAASCVAAGTSTIYDNRLALDSWTIDRVIARAGGSAGLRDRVRRCPTARSWSISSCRCGTSSPASRRWSCPPIPSSSGRWSLD